MTKLPTMLIASLLLLASDSFAPPSAAATDRHGRVHGGAGFHGGGLQHQQFGVAPGVPRPVFPRPFSPHAFVRPIVPFVTSSVIIYTAPPAYAPPPVVYTAPPIVYAPPPVAYAYAPPPVAYAPPPAPAAPPPPPAPPSSVEYPHGRYELRGDGVRTPYVWVWIPNPPPPPPAPSAHYAPPAPERQVYSWTDAQGVTTFTDRLEKVPLQHRPAAR